MLCVLDADSVIMMLFDLCIINKDWMELQKQILQ